ncbi:MAG: DUF1295 domain-containing protein, partial [Spirochaetaceae bacterium]|nr:DUF1295 domain-containing protein [Spirochaetaceae bacterium]
MKTALWGFFTPFIIYGIITALHYLIPGRKVTGYVSHVDTGKKLKYRLNGRFVLILSILIWAFLGFFQIVPFEWLYRVRFYSLAGAFFIGLIFTLLIVLPYPPTGKSLPLDLFFGRLDNPQFGEGKIDAKMWLYLSGAILLQLNALSFASYHYISFGSESSPGVFVCTAMITYFIFDYLTFEEVHLYTYDFFAEKVGFKLGWGCLTFYPFFYSISLFTTAHLPDSGKPLWFTLMSIVLFLSGWILARGANMQKFYFKTQPQKSFLRIQPQTLTEGNKRLLINGFWGASRHINYLGEILMAIGITLSVGYPSNIWG